MGTMTANAGIAERVYGPQGERRTVTVQQAATALGICRNTAYAMARRGDLPTIRMGSRLLVPIAALEKMLNPE